jgi:hypothetical protein
LRFVPVSKKIHPMSSQKPGKDSQSRKCQIRQAERNQSCHV